MKTHISHLIVSVGNMPIEWQELRLDIVEAMQTAKERHEIEVISYAGLFDIIIHPNETFSLIPIWELKCYKLVEDRFYEEVIS